MIERLPRQYSLLISRWRINSLAARSRAKYRDRHIYPDQLMNAGVPLRLIKPYQCEVQVRVLQPKDVQNRYPDLTVLREEHLQLTQAWLTINTYL